MKLYDVVALLEDLPELHLRRGQVGTLVETWEQDVYEVEFADTHGTTYALAALKAEQLMPLYWQPITTGQAED